MEKIFKSKTHMLLINDNKIELLEEYGTGYKPAGFINNIPNDIMSQLFPENKTEIIPVKKPIEKTGKVIKTKAGIDVFVGGPAKKPIKKAVKKTNWKKELQILKKVINKNNLNSILFSIKIDSIDSKATISATNNDNYIVIDTNILYRGSSILVNNNLFFILLKNAKEEKLYNDDENIWFNKDQKAPFFKSNDFPCLPKSKKEIDVFSLNSEKIKKCIPHASNDTIKPVFNGIYLEKDLYCSTDSRRMFLSGDIKVGNGFGVILPLETAKLINNDCKIVIEENNQAIVYLTKQITIYTRLVDGQFPNYKQAIPENFRESFNIDRLVFLDLLNQTKDFTRKPAFKANIEISANEIQLISGDATKTYMTRDISDHTSNDGLFHKSGINVTFIINALKSLNSEIVEVKFSEAKNYLLSPIIIQEVKGDNSLKAIVMPIQIKEEE